MKIIRMLAMAGVSLLPLSSPVWAQSAPSTPAASAGTASSEGAVVDDTIIVEARRRSESLQDVPLTVNAVTSEAVEKLNLRKFEDISSVVPGLRLESNNSIGANTSLRGVRHETNATNNPTVAFYLNDTSVQPDVVYQALFDIGQIEVLRGPQGTLRGKATPSGSITLTTRKPDLNEYGGYVMGTYASADSINANGALNLPIIKEKLAVRIAGLVADGPGDRVHSLNSLEHPHNETQAIRASARFEPVDWFKAGFTYQGLWAKNTYFPQVESFGLVNPAFVAPAGAPNYGTIQLGDRKSIAAFPNRASKKIDFYGWNAEADFAGQSLIYVGSYQHYDVHSTQNQDLSNFYPNVSPSQRVSTILNQTTHEVRLQNQSLLLGHFDYVLGFFRTEGKSQATILNSLITPTGSNTAFLFDVPIVTPYAPSTEQSFFGNLTFHLGDKTEFSGGVRRIHFNEDFPGLTIFGSLNPSTVKQIDANATIYNISVKHRFTDNLMVYAATGSSWRPPNFQIGNFSTAPRSPREAASEFTNAETSTSYEIGVKSQWFQNRLTLNVTGYHQNFKNYPFLGPSASYINYPVPGFATVSQFAFVNAVPVEVNGIEAEIGYRPTSRLNIFNTISYSKSKIGAGAQVLCTDALNNATGAVGSDGIPDLVNPTLAQLQTALAGTGEHVAACPAGGLNPSFQPKISGSTQVEYTMPLSDTVDASLRGLVDWRGSSTNNPLNRFDDVGGYALINLYAGIRDPKGAWEVTAFAKNIFNTVKVLSRNDTVIQPSGVTRDSLYTQVTTNAPSEFGITAKFAFGSR
ncbi:MAG TPA: TonB-dependent receptor [Sphingobium sp.]|uniref:TonB-dependent receptor n=1 Tax=Sphingobium sp. TaxID=1912891 RepID=UPI002ED48693